MVANILPDGAFPSSQYYGLKGKRVVAVTSGSNMNFDRLRLVSGEAWDFACLAGRRTAAWLNSLLAPGSPLPHSTALMFGTSFVNACRAGGHWQRGDDACGRHPRAEGCHCAGGQGRAC